MIENDITSFLFQAGGNPLGSYGTFLPLLFIFGFFGIFYVFLILPQQRRQKRWQAMINDLKTGDRVTTQGGIRGSIIAIKDDAVHLRVPPDNLRLEVAKSAVISVARDEEPKKSEK
jgi:preprotein translocase subunit YajC